MRQEEQEEILARAVTEYLELKDLEFNRFKQLLNKIQSLLFLTTAVSGFAFILVIISYVTNASLGWKQECQIQQLNQVETLEVCKKW